MSFKHTIIIMTSNLGSSEIYKATAGRARTQLAATPLAADSNIRDLVMDQVGPQGAAGEGQQGEGGAGGGQEGQEGGGGREGGYSHDEFKKWGVCKDGPGGGGGGRGERNGGSRRVAQVVYVWACVEEGAGGVGSMGATGGEALGRGRPTRGCAGDAREPAGSVCSVKSPDAPQPSVPTHTPPPSRFANPTHRPTHLPTHLTTHSPQVRRHFPPEFLNRVDEFIIFEPLTAVQVWWGEAVGAGTGGVAEEVAAAAAQGGWRGHWLSRRAGMSDRCQAVPDSAWGLTVRYLPAPPMARPWLRFMHPAASPHCYPHSYSTVCVSPTPPLAPVTLPP